MKVFGWSFDGSVIDRFELSRWFCEATARETAITMTMKASSAKLKNADICLVRTSEAGLGLSGDGLVMIESSLPGWSVQHYTIETPSRSGKFARHTGPTIPAENSPST
jgi:hypothetical protein